MQDNREKTNEEVSRLAEAAHLPHLTGPMRATPWSMDPRVKNGPASSLRVQVNNDKEDEDEDEAAAVEAEATSITAVSQDELPADQLLASAAPAVGDAVYKASSDALTPPSAQPLDASTMVSNWQSSIQEWFSGTATGPAQLFGLLGGFLVFHRVANDGSSAPVTAPTAPTEPTEPTEPTAPIVFGSGNAINGYLANAFVWHDNNNDGRWDSSEPYAFTNAKGAFSDLVAGPGTLRVTGLTDELRAQLTDEPSEATIDISTGNAFAGIFSAPAGSTVITPLTTLVVATGGDPAKLDALKAALGIPDGLNLSNFDPLAALANPNADSASLAMALGAQNAAVKVSNLLAMASSTLGSGGSFDLSAVVGGVAESLVVAAVQAASQGSTANMLNNPAVMQQAMSAAVAAAVDSGSDFAPNTLLTLNAAAQSAGAALSSVNDAMSQTLTAAINAPGGLTLGSALNSLTDSVATKLVVLNELVTSVATAVNQAVESGEPLNGSELSGQFASQFSAEGLASKVEQAKSDVKTVVVIEQGQTILVAADDFANVTFNANNVWVSGGGNVLTNDLSGDAAKTVAAAGLLAGSLSSAVGGSITIQGTYGTLTLQSNGQFSYAVDQGAVRAQSVLAKTAVQLKDIFQYQVLSGEKTDLAQLTVTIPLNPVQITDSNPADNTISENTAPGTVVSGLNLLATDPDTAAITLTLSDAADGLFALVGNQIVLAANQSLNFEDKTEHVVTVQATSADGSTSSQDITIKVLDANDPVQGDLAYSTADNQFKAGKTITAITDDLSDEDGLTGVVFAYQWQKFNGNEWESIRGATAEVLTPSVEGQYRVLVSFKDAKGNAESVTGQELEVNPAESLLDLDIVAGASSSVVNVASRFTDANPGTLSFQAFQLGADNSLQTLPDWLVFDTNLGTFTVTADARHLGTVQLRVLASDGINPAVEDDFNITVSAVPGKGMLSSLGAALEVFDDTTDDNKINFVDPISTLLSGVVTDGVLTFANTTAFVPRGSLLALTDGDEATTSGTPMLSLPLANVPQLSAAQDANLRITFTAGSDTVATNEAQVSVNLRVTYSSELVNYGSGVDKYSRVELFIRAQDQEAEVAVVRGSGEIISTPSLSFTTADVLASTTSTQDGQAHLQLNVLSLLTKLNGTTEGALLGLVLSPRPYTLGFEVLDNGVLPLTDSLGVPIRAIEVGLPISSNVPNQPPSLVFLDDLVGSTQLLAATGVNAPFALGEFLLGQNILAQNKGPQFELRDTDGSVAHVWVFKPEYGTLQLDGDAVEFELLGVEKFIRLSLTDLAKLEYLQPSQLPEDPLFKQEVLVRFLLEDDNNEALSTFNSLTIGLDASLDQPIGFVAGGQAVPLESGLPLKSDAYVQSLPNEELGKVQYKTDASELFVNAEVGDTLKAGSLLQFVPATGAPSDDEVSGQLRLVFFDGEGFSFKVIELGSRSEDNRAPQLGGAVTVSVDENTTFVGEFAAVDLDGHAITYKLDDESAKIFTINDLGELSFRVAPDFEALKDATFTVVITASDGSLTDTQTVTVNVANVNEGVTDIILTGELSVDENTVVVTEIGAINLTLDADVDANKFALVVTDLDSPFEVVGDLVKGFRLQLKADQNLDYESQTSYEVTLRATDSSFEPPMKVDRTFTIEVNNLVDTPTLNHDVLTLLDGGRETTLLGQVEGKTLKFESLAGQGLDRNNLQALLDGNPQTGESSVLQFSLASLAGVVPGQTVPEEMTVGVDVQLASDRAGGMALSASFELTLSLTVTDNGLQMALAEQQVDMVLRVGNKELGTLQAVNLDADTVTLQSGNNATPQLSVKIDNLLSKAMGNLVDLQALNEAAAVDLVGGVLVAALQGANVSDLLKLAQNIAELPDAFQSLQISQLLALGQDAIELPNIPNVTLQSLNAFELLGFALQLGQLPAGASLAGLVQLAQDAITAPDRLNKATLGDLKEFFLSSGIDNADELSNQFEGLTRNVFKLQDGVSVAGKTLGELIEKLNTDFNDLTLSDVVEPGGALQSSLGGLGLGQVVSFAFAVLGQVDNIPFESRTVAEALQALDASIDVPESLQELALQDVLPLFNVNLLSVAAATVIAASGAGLLDVLQSALNSVDATPEQKTQLLDALDGAIDLTPFLGAQFKLSALLEDLPDGQLDLAPLIQAASGFLLSADGQVKLVLSLPDALGLTSGGGVLLDSIEFNLAFKEAASESFQLKLPELVFSEDSIDLSAFLSGIQTEGNEGPDIEGFFIDLPEGVSVDGGFAESGLQRIELPGDGDVKVTLNLAGNNTGLEMTVWAYDSELTLSQGISVSLYEL